MKIGIFGGSFNPIHNMHTDIALYLLSKHYVDKIIFVPTGIKYEYKNNLIANKYRYEMLEIVCQNNENLNVSDYEFKDYVVYTCETLKYFQDMYKTDEIYFICGTDNLSYIDEWKNGLNILKKYKILVINRHGNDIKKLLDKYKEYQNNIYVVPMKLSDISSTFIRNRIKNNEDVSTLLNKDVFEYIRHNNLYKD